MNFTKGQKIWFIFKENYDKDKGEGYKLIAKQGEFVGKLECGEFELTYKKDDKIITIARNGSNIFDSEQKCKDAITKTYQARIYNFLKQAIDIFDRYLKD